MAAITAIYIVEKENRTSLTPFYDLSENSFPFSRLFALIVNHYRFFYSNSNRFNRSSDTMILVLGDTLFERNGVPIKDLSVDSCSAELMLLKASICQICDVSRQL